MEYTCNLLCWQLLNFIFAGRYFDVWKCWGLSHTVSSCASFICLLFVITFSTQLLWDMTPARVFRTYGIGYSSWCCSSSLLSSQSYLPVVFCFSVHWTVCFSIDVFCPVALQLQLIRVCQKIFNDIHVRIHMVRSGGHDSWEEHGKVLVMAQLAAQR